MFCVTTVAVACLLARTPAAPTAAEASAATRVKASEASAKARRSAVRYLAATEPGCHPGAEEALVAALRDAHEMIRLEAARALGDGRRHSARVTEALAEAGNAAEASPRV